MTDIDSLTLIGEALYGRTWQAQMCDLLRVDNRRVAHWLAGSRPIPPGIWVELIAALRERGDAALKLADSLTAGPHRLASHLKMADRASFS